MGLNYKLKTLYCMLVTDQKCLYMNLITVYLLFDSRLIDCFLVDSPVVSLTMSPTSDFLATCHLDDIGVYLWSNMTLFSYVPLRPLPSDFVPQLVDLPSTKRASGEYEDDS